MTVVGGGDDQASASSSASFRSSTSSTNTACSSAAAELESTSATASTSSNSACDLVVSLESLLTRLEETQQQVPGFEDAAGQYDFYGRWQRLHKHMVRLADCSSVQDHLDLLPQDYVQLQALLVDLTKFLDTIHEAKIAPHHRWLKWWEQYGKYARPLEALSNRLNEWTATHIHHVWEVVPLQVENDTEGGDSSSDSTDCALSYFPFTMDQMGLTRPQQYEHEELTGWHSKNDKLSFSQRLSTSMRSTSTASTVSMDSSMRSYSTHGAATSASASHHGHSNQESSSSSGWKSSESNQAQHDLLWDFSPRVLPSSGWGSNGGAEKSRLDLQEQYVQTQRLRELPQDIPVKELRIVLAQLEKGDTSPTIVTAKTAMMTLGMLGALVISPLALTFGLTPQEAIHETPLEAAAVFSHYLMEFELADGTLGTIENCVNDIYLYAGQSNRHQQHVVTTIPMLPNAIGAPNSITRPLVLRDLIRFRNQQRLQPYRLFENNCKHFCLNALTSGELFPKATNMEADNLEVFFQLCQGCYVQQECFDLFTDPRMPLPEEPEGEDEEMDTSMMRRRKLSARDLLMDESSRRRRPVSIVKMSGIDLELD